jgi:hypothetical protein
VFLLDFLAGEASSVSVGVVLMEEAKHVACTIEPETYEL